MSIETLGTPEQSFEEQVTEVIKTHPKLESEFWVSVPGDKNHIQHGFQIHGYIDGVLKSKLSDLATTKELRARDKLKRRNAGDNLPFVEHEFKAEYSKPISDNAQLHFVYERSNDSLLDQIPMIVNYNFHIFAQNDEKNYEPRKALVHAKVQIVGPLQN